MGNRGIHELTETVHEIRDHEEAHFIVYSGHIPCAFNQHFISVGLFQDKQCNIPVEPDAGKAIIEATDDGHQWGDLIHGEINLTDPHYKRPNMRGYVANVRATVVNLAPTGDIHGKYYFRLRVHSY